MEHPFRTRFGKQGSIVAEFYPPLRRKRPRAEKVIIFCPGQPGSPGQSRVLRFWAKQGYWTFRFRYRGTWESSGRFLRRSPARDVLDIVDQLPRGFTEYYVGKRFRVSKSAKIYVFGTSFGGPAALLNSRDRRVTKVVCFSPVVDWRDHRKHGETNSWTERFTRDAFGEAYRFSHSDWKKLDGGSFYNPTTALTAVDGEKVLIIHAEDDTVVRPGPVKRFAQRIGATLWLLRRGGHCPHAWYVKPRFYRKIAKFLAQA